MARRLQHRRLIAALTCAIIFVALACAALWWKTRRPPVPPAHGAPPSAAANDPPAPPGMDDGDLLRQLTGEVALMPAGAAPLDGAPAGLLVPDGAQTLLAYQRTDGPFVEQTAVYVIGGGDPAALMRFYTDAAEKLGFSPRDPSQPTDDSARTASFTSGDRLLTIRLRPIDQTVRVTVILRYTNGGC